MGPFFLVGAEAAAIESAIVVNYEFSEGSVTVTYRDCDALHPSVEYRLEPSGDAWRLAPAVGNELAYLGGPVDEVRVHADGECELRLVVTSGLVSQEVALTAGEVCVLDWCDDLQPGVDKVLVDYCEGEPQIECEEQ